MISMGLIYHITDQGSLDKAKLEGEFKEPSLNTEGFIHFSTREQVTSTARRHYSGRKDLVVFEIDEADVSAHLKYEQAIHGGSYPHVYAAIPMRIIQHIFPLPANPDGSFNWELDPLPHEGLDQ